MFIGSKKLLKKNNVNINDLNIYDIKWESNNAKRQYLENCFNKFYELFKCKKVHGLINLPLNKKEIFDHKFKGVTEFLANKFNRKNKETMLLYNEKFSVSPLTTHIKIKNIAKEIKQKKIMINFLNIYNFYKKILKIKKPKIAILGLNPHNGTDFDATTEEKKIIIPTIKLINKKFNNNIYGPISPDVSFLIRDNLKLNCIIGLYHDQVLTTFKYINKYDAANITLGLPFIRLSPDHGTAKNIIGKNKADPKSFLYCLNFFEKIHKSI